MNEVSTYWFGCLPEDWSFGRAKFFVKIRNGSNPQSDGDTPVYGSGDGAFKSCGEFKEGPTVLLGRKGTIDIPHWIEGRYWNVDTAFDVLSHNDFNLRYYYYLSIHFEYLRYMTQTALPSMKQSDYENMYIPLPSPDEQSRIVAFLDDCCAKIDEAIARHQALIEKLDEYRKSVISKAVTKGVRGEREMKESGVDWIGMIPSDWNIIKGRYIYEVLSGYPLDSEKFSMTEGYPMIRIRDITSGEIETYYDGDFPSQYIVTKGELLIGMDGDFRVRQWDNIDAVLNQRCCKITERKYAIRRYLFYVLPLYLKRINDVIFGTTVKHLSVPDLKSAELPVPSPTEQKEIVEYLDSKCAAIDSAKERHTQLIAKLEEYKKSLIYNAVTGKIEC